MPTDSEPLPAFPNIDVTSAIDYMEAHNVGVLNLTIEALGVGSKDLSEPEVAIAIIERVSMTESATPSDLGLQGVFCIMNDDES